MTYPSINEDRILESYAYVYDKNSNIVSETHVSNLNGAEINETRAYTYDSYGRLTESETTDHRNNNAVSVVTYGYDSVGNRTSMTEDGVTTSYTYNGLNQLTEKTKAGEETTYLYDARGNQIQEQSGNTVTNFTYGVTGEMLSVSNGTTVIQENQYNHEGIRISRTEGSTERKYLYDNGSVAYTLDNNAVSAANVLGGYQNTIGTYRGSNYYVYNKDIQGSTESITNSSFIAKAAYEYSDFGEVTELIEAIDNEICYTGSIHDETTGLHYMNARYYDPENGRFISQDSYRGELDDVGQWHLYVYCANNPINYVDPSGHSAWSLAWGIASEVVSLVALVSSAKWTFAVGAIVGGWQIAVAIYDYNKAQKDLKRKYGKSSSNYKKATKMNNFMLGLAIGSAAISVILNTYGLKIFKKAGGLKKARYDVVNILVGFGICRSINLFGVSHDMADLLAKGVDPRFRSK